MHKPPPTRTPPAEPDAVDPKVQWCELHQGPARDVAPLRGAVLSGGPPDKMACQACLKVLVLYGLVRHVTRGEPHKWYWRLRPGRFGVAVGVSSRIGATKRFPYELNCTLEQVILLRALGFEVLKDEDS